MVRTADDCEWLVTKHAATLDRIRSVFSPRQGSTSFKNALPQAQSDLANEIVRDPYNFEFLTLRDQAAERELEDGLLARRSMVVVGFDECRARRRPNSAPREGTESRVRCRRGLKRVRWSCVPA